MKAAKKKSSAREKQPKPHPIDVHVGKRIRHFRHLRGMSQTTLAEQIGVGSQQLHRYETADNRLSASKLQLAAKALDVSIKDLFGDD